MKELNQYCQKCRSANRAEDELCAHCGTRLMIVTIPPSYRHDEHLQPGYYEQFLLEKISALELRVSRLTNIVENMVAMFEISNSNQFEERKIVEQILGILSPAGEGGEGIEAQGKDDRQIAAPPGHNDFLHREFISGHGDEGSPLFLRLLQDGFRFLSINEENQAYRSFSRALELSPSNIALCRFLAYSAYFGADQRRAMKYLKRCMEIAPGEEKNIILLAAIYADDWNFRESAALLSFIHNHDEANFLKDMIRGMIHSCEESWADALASFEDCLRFEESPELLYLAGCCLFQMKKEKEALANFSKAAELDPSFSDAWFMKSRVLSAFGKKKESEEAREKVAELNDMLAQAYAFKNSPDKLEEKALPFSSFQKKERQFFLSFSKRINDFLKKRLKMLADI